MGEFQNLGGKIALTILIQMYLHLLVIESFFWTTIFENWAAKLGLGARISFF